LDCANLLKSLEPELRAICNNEGFQFNIQKLASFDSSEENSRVWFLDVHQDLGFATFQKISDRILKECIEKGVIGHDWKKSGKYHFDEDNFDHLGVGKTGNVLAVKAHLTFLRYNVSSQF
jgi:AKAP7 2'5' RNA ligase-like domain